jgi:hypothetical protein
MQFTNLSEAVELIQTEYLEMPGLRLTSDQAQKLCNLSNELCDRALGALVDSGFLARRGDGTYVRRGAPPMSIEEIESLLRAM